MPLPSPGEPNPQPPEGGSPRQGSPEEFVTLLGAHEREVFAYIFSLTGNWNDAQEVMQRVRIRIWQQFDQFDHDKPFGPWARAIAYFLVLAFRKEKSRQREYFSEQLLEAVSETFAQQADTLGERRDALIGCLKKLPQSQRKLVDTYYARSVTVSSLAEELGTSPTALRQTLFRIRKILQSCVRRQLTH